jgi:hypothetical protein
MKELNIFAQTHKTLFIVFISPLCEDGLYGTQTCIIYIESMYMNRRSVSEPIPLIGREGVCFL